MIDILVWAFIIWSLLQFARVIVNAMALKEVQVKVKEHLDKIIHEVKVEKHQDTEYWFDKETDQFLGQGKTIEEITAHIKSRFPNHIFVLPPKGVLCAPKWQFVDQLDHLERIEHYADK